MVNTQEEADCRATFFGSFLFCKRNERTSQHLAPFYFFINRSGTAAKEKTKMTHLFFNAIALQDTAS